MFLPNPKPRPPLLDLLSGLKQVFTRPTDGNIFDHQDWFKRWDIQPAADARYVPEFPQASDTSLGADIRRNWHDRYKNFARDSIAEHASEFAMNMAESPPEQSFGDFMDGAFNQASDQLPASPFERDRAPVAPAPEQFGPALPSDFGTTPTSPVTPPQDINPMPSVGNILTQGTPEVLGTIVGGINPAAGAAVEKIGGNAASVWTEQDHQKTINQLEQLREYSRQAGNKYEEEIWKNMKKAIEQEREGRDKGIPLAPVGLSIYTNTIDTLNKQLPAARELDKKKSQKKKD